MGCAAGHINGFAVEETPSEAKDRTIVAFTARLDSSLKNSIGGAANENPSAGAKALGDLLSLSGTTEVVPFQNVGLNRFFQQAVKLCPFKTAALMGFSASSGAVPFQNWVMSIGNNSDHFGLISGWSVRIINLCKTAPVVAAVTRIACRGDLSLHF